MSAPGEHGRDGVVLEAVGVGKQFRRTRVLDGFSMVVGRGEVVALVGANGAGKTTALRICAGLLAPDRGTVRRARSVGYCPQEPGVVGNLDADEHLVLFGASLGIDATEARRRGRDILDGLGFPVGDRTVARELSGGTRQKLNLALALLGDPELLLLDEPYQGFDLGSYIDFWEHVDGWRAGGRAVVVVTHLLTEQQRVDRTVELHEPQPAVTVATVTARGQVSA